MIGKNKKRIVITLGKETLLILEEMQNKRLIPLSKSTIIKEAIWSYWNNQYER